MSARKSSHGTIFLIVSSGSPLALIASSLRSTSKKPVCPMTRSLHPPMAHCGQRVRFVATWREEFFKVPKRLEGGKFRWPRIEDGVMRLSAAQLAALIEGLDWMRVRARLVPTPDAVQ